MHSVTGTFKNGVVELNESVSWTDGQQVTITVAGKKSDRSTVPPLKPEGKVTLDDLLEFIEEYAIDTGIEDLAHQHDHYLYGTPKTDRYPE